MMMISTGPTDPFVEIIIPFLNGITRYLGFGDSGDLGPKIFISNEDLVLEVII